MRERECGSCQSFAHEGGTTSYGACAKGRRNGRTCAHYICPSHVFNADITSDYRPKFIGYHYEPAKPRVVKVKQPEMQFEGV